MSYCRFSAKTKVHMVDTGHSVLCAGCHLIPDNNDAHSIEFNDKKDALNHMIMHLRAGHHPPKNAIRQLLNEIIEDAQYGDVKD